MSLPFDAEWSRAADRRFEEAAVFVHHFGGDKRSSLRHAALLNDLGYDCVRFTLASGPRAGTRLALPIASDLRWGLRAVWADQIEGALNAVPQRKFVYSFSMPSASAIAAVARRRARDVAALVCDGGPFLRMPECVWNLYEKEYRVESRVLRAALTGLSLVAWGFGDEREAKARLAEIPSGFPILSIRGWEDPLVSPDAIDDFWRLQDHLRVEAFALPKGGHLDGLKRFPEEYSARVGEFLRRAASPI